MNLDPETLALSVGAGAAAGLVGCFAVMRRMTLAADAISHIALPGIGLALVVHIYPVVGAAAMLLIGMVIVWGVEIKTGIATETVIGVMFSTALAVGSMITSGDDLIEALFGDTARLSVLEAALGLVIAAVIVVFIWRERHRLVLALVSPEIARTAGINVARLDLRFLLIFALTIALGLRYLGVLLIGSLVIVPAATAKRLARSLNGMLAISVSVAILSTTIGTVASAVLARPAGPLVVIVAAICFFASLLRRAKSRHRSATTST
ncbi:MAG: metal ABC transporter permease [Kofleriaceae bacterium]